MSMLDNKKAAVASNVPTLGDSDLICCDDIPSVWRSKIQRLDAQIQTLPLQFADSSQQSIDTADASGQTDSTTQPQSTDPAAAAAFAASATQPLNPAVAHFINSVAPLLITQLELNLNSHAFDEWTGSAGGMSNAHSSSLTDASTASTEGTDASQYECLFTLTNALNGSSSIVEQPKPVIAQSSTKSKKKSTAITTQSTQTDPDNDTASLQVSNAFPSLPCIGLSWNSSGSILAVIHAHTRASHVGWCTHSGSSSETSRLCWWNVMRRRLVASTPDAQVELPACATTLAFHPQLPSLLAVGLISGEIRLYDASRMEQTQDASTNEQVQPSTQAGTTTAAQQAAAQAAASEPLLAASSLDDLYHRDAVTQLVWLPSSKDNRVYTRLASLGLDGKLLVWTPLQQSLHTHANSNALLSATSLSFPTRDSRSLRPTAQYHGLAQSVGKSLFPYYGGTSVDFVLNINTSSSNESSKDAYGSIGSYVVGTECGGLLRGQMTSHPILELLNKTSSAASQAPVKSGDLTWSYDAHQLIVDAASSSSASSSTSTTVDLKRHVERHFQLRAHTGQILIRHVYDSQPLASALYASVGEPASHAALDGCSGSSVNAIVCNPFDGRLVAIVSTNTTHSVLIYNLASSSTSPLIELTVTSSSIAAQTSSIQLLDCRWSNTCPLVLATSTSTGEIHIFDLLNSIQSPACVIQCNKQGQSIMQLRFNSSSNGQAGSEMLASCDALGRAQVWRLPLHLSEMRNRELQLMQQLIASATQEQGRDQAN